jgi:hypothetical protein
MAFPECERIEGWFGLGFGLGTLLPSCTVAALLRVPLRFGRGDRNGFGLGTGGWRLGALLTPSVTFGGIFELSEESGQRIRLGLRFYCRLGLGGGGW